MSSSRPVKLTGWNETTVTLSALSIANSTIGPTWSLLTPLTTVTPGTTSMPAAARFSIARQLDVEQVADLAVAVGRVADAVELQVGDAQAGLLGRMANSGSWAKRMPLVADCTREVADLARVAHGVQEDAGEMVGSPPEKLHRHLPARLHRDGVVEDLSDLLPASARARSRPGWRP